MVTKKLPANQLQQMNLLTIQEGANWAKVSTKTIFPSSGPIRTECTLANRQNHLVLQIRLAENRNYDAQIVKQANYSADHKSDQ